MHRIDTAGNEDGLFQDGNPQAGQQGTVMDADWANAVQEEIASVIEGAGMELDKGEHDQLKDAIAAMIATAAASARPVGEVVQIDGTTVPAGMLPLNGSQWLRADYPQLVAWYVAQGRDISGDGPTQFRTPNYMGRFPRAWSTDNTVDPEGPRAPGSLQADAFAAHTHAIPSNSDQSTGDGFVEDANGSGTARTTATGSTGGAETRGKNVALLWCVVAR